MPWLLVDLALVLLGLLALALAGLRLWRGVKALGTDVAAAGEAVGGATAELARLQAELETRSRPDTPPSPARHR